MESLDLTNPNTVKAEFRNATELSRGSGFSKAMSTEFQSSPDYDDFLNREWTSSSSIAAEKRPST